MTSKERCNAYRRRILAISQQVSALHIAPAFSCLEIVDTIYRHLMVDGDAFIMSKGHGCMAQYVVLEGLGKLPSIELRRYCTPKGKLGAHPDRGQFGIEASTGSLGHGLGMAVGMAYAEWLKGGGRSIYALISDGELQEGSTWEAIMMARNLRLDNLLVFVDNNDFGGLERMSERHCSFYPVKQKFEAFGWEAALVDGHDSDKVLRSVRAREGGRPYVLNCRTVKGKGVLFMENKPIWHYRSPNKEEYEAAMQELSVVTA